MIPAYNGSEPYIFVSYAHKDSEEVYGTLEKLTSLGYRIWYDEGIKPGVEWPENIAEHLDRCALFMMFISPNSMASANCRREINFALSRSKKFLCIVLKQTEIPLGMELQLSSQQSIFRYKYSSEKAYIYKICSAAGMAQCKEHHYFETESAPVMSSGADAERSLMTASPNAEKSPAPEARRKKASGRSSKNNLNGAVLVGILIGAVIIFAFTFMLFKDSSLFKGGGNATITVTPSLTPTLTPTPTPTVTPTSAPTVTPTPIMTQDTQAAGTTTDTTNTTNTDTTNNDTGAQDTTDDTDQTDSTTTDEDEDYTVIIEGNTVIDEEEGARAEYGDYDTYGDT